MLQYGYAVPASDSLAGDDVENINSILNYLWYHGHFSPVAPWFGLEDNPDYSDMNEKLAALGLDKNEFIERNHCNIYFDRPFSVSTVGYDELLFPQLDFIDVNELNGMGMKKIDGTNVYELLNKDGHVDQIDFTGYINFLNGKYNCADRKYDPTDARFEISGEHFDFMLVTEWMEYNIENGVELGNWRGALLLRDEQ